MNIGSRLAQLREDRGWTQEQTAAALGISRAALSHYEKDRREPDTDTLTKFADLYCVTIDYLFGRTDNPSIVVDPNVRDFVDQLELSDDELLHKFALTIDGHRLTTEEAKRFIAFIRAERMMR